MVTESIPTKDPCIFCTISFVCLACYFMCMLDVIMFMYLLLRLITPIIIGICE